MKLGVSQSNVQSDDAVNIPTCTAGIVHHGWRANESTYVDTFGFDKSLVHAPGWRHRPGGDVCTSARVPSVAQARRDERRGRGGGGGGGGGTFEGAVRGGRRLPGVFWHPQCKLCRRPWRFFRCCPWCLTVEYLRFSSSTAGAPSLRTETRFHRCSTWTVVLRLRCAVH